MTGRPLKPLGRLVVQEALEHSGEVFFRTLKNQVAD